MPIDAPILEVKPPPPYRRIAPTALPLQELGLSQSEIGRRLGIDRWTVGKALRWLRRASRRPRTSSFATRPTRAIDRQSVCAETKSCYKMGMAALRILVHLSRSEQRVLDPDEVYYLRARGGETEVRLRSRTPLVDVRPIGELAPLLEPFGFVRVHREHAVNLGRIRLLRLQADGRDWELKLEPPVNRVLPIARDRLAGLRAALGAPAG